MKGKSMVEGTPWKHILRFALPVLAGSLLQQLYNTVDTIVVGNFSGEDALSAVGTTGSNLYGAEHWCREDGQSEKRSCQAVFMSLLLTLCISLLVWIFSGNIIRLFGLSGKATVYCTAHLKTIALITIVLALYIPLFGVFQGANHGGAPTIVAAGALGVRVLVTYLFRYSELFGYSIIWWNGLFGFGMGFLITWTYYLSNQWQKNSSVFVGEKQV